MFGRLHIDIKSAPEARSDLQNIAGIASLEREAATWAILGGVGFVLVYEAGLSVFIDDEDEGILHDAEDA